MGVGENHSAPSAA